MDQPVGKSNSAYRNLVCQVRRSDLRSLCKQQGCFIGGKSCVLWSQDMASAQTALLFFLVLRLLQTFTQYSGPSVEPKRLLPTHDHLYLHLIAKSCTVTSFHFITTFLPIANTLPIMLQCLYLQTYLEKLT